MDSGLQVALISVPVSAVVSISVSIINPWWAHTLWKRQKLKEQQLAAAERFAAILASFPENQPDEPIQLSWHFTSLLVLIGTLFKGDELRVVAIGLAKSQIPFTTRLHAKEFGKLQALLFEEALDIKRKR